jgi:hypothetical protein
MRSLALLALVSLPAFAQVSYKLPTPYQVEGRLCGSGWESYSVTGFDASTSTYTGRVFAYTRCGGSGRGGGYSVTYYVGCASAVWDSVGNLLSYTVEWRSSGRTLVPASACLGG